VIVLPYPRVELLVYQLTLKEDVNVRADAELVGEVGSFRFQLRDGLAQFFPLVQFVNEKLARASLDPLLRAWEVSTELLWRPGRIGFVFQRARTVRLPPKAGVIEVEAGSMVVVGSGVVLGVTRENYPPPLTDFVLDGHVQTLAELHRLASSMPSIVLYLGYSMLTLVESVYGGRGGAAASLALSTKLLDAVARLTNTRGMGAEARKHVASQQKPSLSDGERIWLLNFMREVVLRAGRVASGARNASNLDLGSTPVPPS
jgi:hypothetical protein